MTYATGNGGGFAGSHAIRWRLSFNARSNHHVAVCMAEQYRRNEDSQWSSFQMTYPTAPDTTEALSDWSAASDGRFQYLKRLYDHHAADRSVLFRGGD